MERLLIISTSALLFCFFAFFLSASRPAWADPNIITVDLLNKFLPERFSTQSQCDSRGFYSHPAFLEAARSFPSFASGGSPTVQKQELAAFFANVVHETGEGCYVRETEDNRRGQPYGNYYGRGPLQLTWDYNYRDAGNSIGRPDLAGNPDLLAEDNVLSFKASLWFWMVKGPHADMVNGKGFGATIQAINSGECGTDNGQKQDRISLYKSFCSNDLGVDPGSNLSC